MIYGLVRRCLSSARQPPAAARLSHSKALQVPSGVSATDGTHSLHTCQMPLTQSCVLAQQRLRGTLMHHGNESQGSQGPLPIKKTFAPTSTSSSNLLAEPVLHCSTPDSVVLRSCPYLVRIRHLLWCERSGIGTSHRVIQQRDRQYDAGRDEWLPGSCVTMQPKQHSV
jgi:hypothetical protein